MGNGPGLRNQDATRNGLRALGAVLLIVGGVLTVIGLADFFGSFGDFDAGFPTKFPLAVVGLPMAGVGAKLLAAGYLGAGSRYVAGEVAPVARDSMAYMRAGEAACPQCGAANDAAARFCDACGTAMPAARAG